MSLRTSRLSVPILVLAALILAACPTDEPDLPAQPEIDDPPPGDEEVEVGGELIIGVTTDAVSMDMKDGGGSPSSQVRVPVYDTLVWRSPDLEFFPSLAASWEVEETEWTFHLRQGVVFHDGTPFNAEAVKHHFDELLTGEYVRSGHWTPFLESVDVIDEYTVRFTTFLVDAFFLDRLADDSAGIPSPTAVEQGTLAEVSVGTGPFRFVEWVSDVHIVLERNDDYWGTPARLDRVVFRPIAEASARAIAVVAGDVDVAQGIPAEALDSLEGTPGIEVFYRDSTRQLWVGMANLDEPFNDVRVRQALNYAVDWDAIVETIYGGELARVVPGAVAPTQIGYAEVQGFDYDPERARALLEEAGYPDGLQLRMVGPTGRYLKDFEFQQAAAAQLAEVGIEVELEPIEFAAYIELVRQPTRDTERHFWMDAWSAGDAARTLRTRYHCGSFVPDGNNLAGYCNPDMDALVEQAEQTLDEQQRDDLLRQAQEMIVMDAPSVWGIVLRLAAAQKEGVEGVLLFPGEALTVNEHTWIAR